jgi:hypothetical protein
LREPGFARFVNQIRLGKAIADSLLKRQGIHDWFLWTEPRPDKVERAMAQTPKIERK